MTDESTASATQLLQRWRAGDQAALNSLMSQLSAELHRIAAHRMSAERGSHTLQATALINEAYLRLADADVTWQDRAHFIAVISSTMRRVLIDHAKARQREKRGAGMIRVTLADHSGGSFDAGAVDLFALNTALDRLAELDTRKCQLIELHYFGGLTYEEAAEARQLSPATIHRELRLAKAWLARELRDGRTSGTSSERG